MQLLEMTSNPDVSLMEIAELIQSDPGLASKVLKTVNSSFYGLASPCPSIDRAIVILGLKAIKSLVLGFSMVNLTKGIDDDIDLDVFWKHTIIAAVGARLMAQAAGVVDPDEVFAAALMQDIGVLATLASYTDQYTQLVAEARSCHHTLLTLEKKHLGLDHIAVGTALAEKWKMPGPIVSGIRYHHDLNPPLDDNQVQNQCIVVGELIANTMSTDHIGQCFAELYSTSNAWFGQGEEDIEELIEKVQLASQEVAKLLEHPLGEVPSTQELMSRASERMFEEQLQTQREAEQAHQDAKTDGLTGVPNRAHFEEVLSEAFANASADRRPLSILFSDADKFKFVNDTYGHPCGDAVLVELANRITQAVGDDGTVCRYGGEEFVIVLPNTPLEEANAVGERVRQAVADRPFDLQGVPGAPPEPLPRTVSVGVATMAPGDHLSAEQLVRRADKAVYTAKESGRNNVRVWGKDTGRRRADQRADEAAALGISLDAVPADNSRLVLLIEDDPLAARMIQSMLEKSDGVEVEVKTDGRMAIEYLRDCQAPGRRTPDLIISDINIPGYNGLQIIRALRANVKFQQVPIVVVSGTIDEEITRSCIEAGVDGVYDKIEISTDLKAWCADLIQSLPKAA